MSHTRLSVFVGVGKLWTDRVGPAGPVRAVSVRSRLAMLVEPVVAFTSVAPVKLAPVRQACAVAPRIATTIRPRPSFRGENLQRVADSAIDGAD
jgi:hypothetical protein